MNEFQKQIKKYAVEYFEVNADGKCKPTGLKVVSEHAINLIIDKARKDFLEMTGGYAGGVLDLAVRSYNEWVREWYEKWFGGLEDVETEDASST